MCLKNNETQGFISVSLQQGAPGSHFSAFSCNKKEYKEDRKKQLCYCFNTWRFNKKKEALTKFYGTEIYPWELPRSCQIGGADSFCCYPPWQILI